jgi:hypothetical protein
MNMLIAAAASIAVSTTSAADISVEDLKAQNAALEARIANLERGDNIIAEKRSQFTQQMVQQILVDADSHTKDHPVTLDVHGFAITRYQYNNGGGVARNNEFKLPYARLELSGKVYDYGYLISGEYSDQNNGDMELVDAVFSGKMAGLDFKVGQFVTSFYKGWTDSPLDLATGEYSLVATTFGQGRSQGIEFSKDFGMLTLTGSYNDGFNTQNATVGTDYGISVRADMDLGSGFNFGAAFAHQDMTVVDYNTYTVDFGYKSGNWDAGVAWVASDVATGSSDNYGLVGTLAYQCSKDLQGFLQYERGQAGAGADTLSLVTVGCNYDLAPGVRWTTSLGYSMNTISGGWNTYRSGWNGSGEDGEYLLTTQLALSF